jgi:hypothetical protein
MKLIFVFLCCLCLVSCVQMNYIKDVVPITQRHQIIAVLPPITTIERKIWMSDDKYRELTIQKQNELQKKLIKSFEFRFKNGTSFVEIMDVQLTNDVVTPLGYPQVQFSPLELCKRLNVDGVIESRIDIREPTNELTALVFQNNGMSNLYTNTLNLKATLFDTLHSVPLWELVDVRFGYLGSIKLLMQRKSISRTTRNSPYNIKKNPFKKLYLESIKEQ